MSFPRTLRHGPVRIWTREGPYPILSPYTTRPQLLLNYWLSVHLNSVSLNVLKNYLEICSYLVTNHAQIVSKFSRLWQLKHMETFTEHVKEVDEGDDFNRLKRYIQFPGVFLFICLSFFPSGRFCLTTWNSNITFPQWHLKTDCRYHNFWIYKTK